MDMILETLIKEVEECGKSRYAISKETGIPESQLTRLMQGRDFRSSTASKLLEYFGYRLTKSKGGRKK